MKTFKRRRIYTRNGKYFKLQIVASAVYSFIGDLKKFDAIEIMEEPVAK